MKLKELSDQLRDKSIEERLEKLVSFFPGRIIFTTSFGIEDQVITHKIFSNNLAIKIVTLDTGRLFPETYEVFAQTLLKYNEKINVYFPEYEDVEKMVTEKGPFSFLESKENRMECCRLRKVVPLNRALSGMKCWISGIRANQSDNRSQMSELEYDEEKKLSRFHPLFNWSLKEVETYIKENKIPYNSLHDRGFVSIGCEPCTRAVKLGEDFRAGRWWWENDGPRECGCILNKNGGRRKAKGKKNKEKMKNQNNINDEHLRELEDEAIFVMREVAAQFENKVLLFSGGKDSIVLVHIARKAFWPARIPFSLMHIDTGHNFEETLKFRDDLAKEFGAELIVRHVQDSINLGRVVEEQGVNASRNKAQSITLLDAIEELKIDVAIGGGRRDEEKARAKERFFSHRNEFGQWDPKNQRPELWNIFNGRKHSGEHFRVFPISNWTELDVWQYILNENIKLPELYYTHRRKIFKRNDVYLAWAPFMKLKPNEKVYETDVRCRTIGDITCTGVTLSKAESLEEIISEIAATRVTERGGRYDDKRSEAAMEDRKKEGYF